MSLAYAVHVCAVPVVRAGGLAREICRRNGRGEVAAVFERSFYLRVGEDFICIGEPAIGNGPTTLIAAHVAELGLRQEQRAFISEDRIAIGDVVFDLVACQTWHAPPWPALSSPAALRATCRIIARAARESPRDSLAHAVFAAADTPLARLARPRIARFESWLSEQTQASSSSAKADDPVTTDLSEKPRGQRLLDAPTSRGMTRPESAAHAVHNLVGLGPGLTPSGDDFVMGALAALDALGQTNIRTALGETVVASAHRTSPLSASLLRAAAAGHMGENLHMMIAAIVTGDADAAIATAARIGHTSGWDALAGTVVTARGVANAGIQEA
jgi:hypothetical protein